MLRAARALAEETGQPADFHLTLDKQLPVAAGLGGGSSDAGAALRLLRDAARPGMSDDAMLAKIAARLGADGAACLHGRPVIAEGHGERLTPAPRLPELWTPCWSIQASPSPTGRSTAPIDQHGRRPGGRIVPPCRRRSKAWKSWPVSWPRRATTSKSRRSP